ncbi:Deleted in azoospermia-like protein, partial [Ophiophagus hannah]
MSTSNQDSQNTNIPLEESSQLPATSQGYVLPEGKIMPNTIFVGGIDIRMDETEIRTFFTRYGTVKEVKIITDRTGVSKGTINFSLLVTGAYHVPPRPMLINSPTPQFHGVWSNQETYMQSPAVMSPVTQYVQAYPYGCPALLIQQQVPVGYQPTYNYQAYTTVNYGSEMDVGTDQAECSMTDTAQSCANSPQKKSVDRSIQTVVSCLCNPDNRLRNNIVTQEDYLKVSIKLKDKSA